MNINIIGLLKKIKIKKNIRFFAINRLRMEMKKFSYTPEDVGTGENTFDEIWEREWKRVADAGLLRYNQPKTNTNVKMVDQPFKFAFQYLFDRGVKRRS